MDSINFFKGYGKVNNPAGNQQPASNRRRRILLAASLAVFLTIVLGAMIGALIYESATEPPESEEEQLPASDSGESLKTVCAVTQYLDSCINSISALNDPPKSDPVHFFNLSLQVSQRELASLASLPKTLISKSNDRRAESALKDCVNLFDDSLSQLNRSAELMKVAVVGPAEKLLTEMRISDMQTWISAAMTDQDTCLDGLDEMGSTVVDELRTRVHKSSEYMSISLAILNNLKSLVEKFGLKMP
ncbi:pectinesterase 1-like [Coffea arabica]|uniref:pectinesterase n=1 Tax=Coffea arabica TaxID=13443 RepID=A0A6P6X3Z0_COFAR|nr:pectinesterase 1-like [Coffea arabica]